MIQLRRPAAILATGVLAATALGGCGDSDEGADANGGSQQEATEQSDGGGSGGGSSEGGASDDGGSTSGSSDGGGGSDAGGSGGSGSEVSSQPAADADLREVTFPVDPQKAIDTALAKTGDGTVHAIELDHDSEDDAWQYDVKVLAGSDDHKVTIDAVSGKVVHAEHESTDDREKAIDLKDPMPFDEGLKTASEKSDGPLRGWKLEWDDGHRAYQFDIGPEHETPEVTVDVDSGSARVDD